MGKTENEIFFQSVNSTPNYMRLDQSSSFVFCHRNQQLFHKFPSKKQRQTTDWPSEIEKFNEFIRTRSLSRWVLNVDKRQIIYFFCIFLFEWIENRKIKQMDVSRTRYVWNNLLEISNRNTDKIKQLIQGSVNIYSSPDRYRDRERNTVCCRTELSLIVEFISRMNCHWNDKWFYTQIVELHRRATPHLTKTEQQRARLSLRSATKWYENMGINCENVNWCNHHRLNVWTSQSISFSR